MMSIYQGCASIELLAADAAVDSSNCLSVRAGPRLDWLGCKHAQLIDLMFFASINQAHCVSNPHLSVHHSEVDNHPLHMAFDHESMHCIGLGHSNKEDRDKANCHRRVKAQEWERVVQACLRCNALDI